MDKPHVIVIGGGPAGVSAAIEVARAGLTVEIFEQRETLGGAVYRQPAYGTAFHQPARWQAIMKDFLAASIPVHHGSVFLGVDGDGVVLIENRNIGRVEKRRAAAVIIATGAVEKVFPRSGWHQPGVSTAGGLQLMMKETSRAPEGKVLLAGSGPLLIAVAAQMTRLGNPPVAIIEAGDPFLRVKQALQLLPHTALMREAMSYLATIFAKRVPWIRGAQLIAIEKDGAAFSAVIRKRDGSSQRIAANRIGLHDGIRPNNFGLPTETTELQSQPLVLRAGDCREALGSMAASADGRRAGRTVVAKLLKLQNADQNRSEIDQLRAAQNALSLLFAPLGSASPLDQLSDETILCRCEGRTAGDLRRLCERSDPLSGREVKHNGRFAMGACQGRFCAENTAAFIAQINKGRNAPVAQDLTGQRWPVRPVSIAALTNANAINDNNN